MPPFDGITLPKPTHPFDHTPAVCELRLSIMPDLTHKHPSPPAPTRWISFLAHFLIILSAWTLVIKYIFPVAYALAYGLPLTTHIFWDLWPLFHLWLAWALLRGPSYTRLLAVAMSAMEIVIIVTLFYRFLSGPDPEWSIWRTNWFINKVFVLSCFLLILGTFAFRRGNPHNPKTSTPS